MGTSGAGGGSRHSVAYLSSRQFPGTLRHGATSTRQRPGPATAGARGQGNMAHPSGHVCFGGQHISRTPQLVQSGAQALAGGMIVSSGAALPFAAAAETGVEAALG
jgi:hypothetical protein